MRRYKAVELTSGEWAVQIGRKGNNGAFRFLTDTVTDVKEDAEQSAEYYEALHILYKVRGILPTLSEEQAKEVGRAAYCFKLDVQERLEELGAVDKADPYGWLA